MSQSTANPKDLFAQAAADGILSPAASQVITVANAGTRIKAALGISVDDVKASEVLLVTIMVDDSGSIRMAAGNTEAVREGHNGVLDALGASKQTDSILVCTRLLNGEVICPYAPLSSAVRLDTHNYNPDKGTPLYDETVVLLGTVLAKAQEFVNNGVTVRTATLNITDGSDQHSRKHEAADVAKIVADMLREETHIIAGMGIDDGYTDFRSIFSQMGIRDEWILTPKKTPSEIRKAFAVFSQSAVRASQSAAQFSTVSVGGFGG